MKAKVWLISWFIIVMSVLFGICSYVYRIDPYFHYHKPDTEGYFYQLNYPRGQNDGIVRNFDYDAIITGTSMTENFRTTEANRIFGYDFIKVSFPGGSYKEVNDNVTKALEVNSEVRMVIRSLDMWRFLESWDAMEYEPSEYPKYLYDENPFNDVEYLLNRDVLFSRVYVMAEENDEEGFEGGITTFDDYSRWQDAFSYGINTVSPAGLSVSVPKEEIHLSMEDKETIEKNITLNVTGIADAYPEVEFYYFYTPYSIAQWNEWKNVGTIYQILEAEEYITKLILPHNNIHLFSFNNRTDLTTDLNNYKDERHYACWINSLILKWMHEGQYQITEENYQEYLKQEYDFYTTFDYPSINGQEDYEADYYAAALLNEELTGIKPLDVLNEDGMDRNTGYLGIAFNVNLDKGYNYLCFSGQKTADQGTLTVYVYDESGEIIREMETDFSDLDYKVHQFVLDLSIFNGMVTVVMNGSGVGSSIDSEKDYLFSEIYMY